MMPSVAKCFRVSKGEQEGANNNGSPLQIAYQQYNVVAAACYLDLLILRTKNSNFTILEKELANFRDYAYTNMYIQNQGPPTVFWNDVTLVINNIMFY